MDQYTRPKPAIRKQTGIGHFRAAAGYSAAGARRALQESAFRQELGAGLCLAIAYLFLNASLAIWIAALVLFVLMLAIEALNTAVEEIVDRISPELSATGRNAKDLGSFAVLCAISANALLLVYALTAHFLPQIVPVL